MVACGMEPRLRKSHRFRPGSCNLADHSGELAVVATGPGDSSAATSGASRLRARIELSLVTPVTASRASRNPSDSPARTWMGGQDDAGPGVFRRRVGAVTRTREF